MTIVWALLAIVLSGVVTWQLLALGTRMEASPWAMWLRGLAGATLGVGVSVIVGGLIVLFLPYPSSAKPYLLMALSLCFVMMLLPVGALGGVFYHTRRVPKI